MIKPKISRLETEIDLFAQQYFVQNDWGVFRSYSKDNTLYIYGEWKDKGYRNQYKFSIYYVPNKILDARIIHPQIKPASDIHINPDGTICLYHRRDYTFNKKFIISKEIIPWVLEWTIWYEVYLINGGIWLGPEASHG